MLSSLAACRGPAAGFHAGFLARGRLLAGCLALLSLVLAARSPACETPVYRYAMYRWQPTPYEVYLMRREPATPGDAEVLARIKELSRDRRQPANLLAFDVNLAEPDALDRVPADVKRFWEAQPETPTPTFLITSPRGIHVHTGPLDKQQLDRLVQSPAREQLTGELAAGKAGVLLLLNGTDDAANDSAHKLLQQIATDIAAGKVSLYSAPAAGASSDTGPSAGAGQDDDADADAAGDVEDGTEAGPGDAKDAGEEGGEDAGEEGEDAGKDASVPVGPSLQIGVLRVDRDDPAEQWLVRTLLAVEDDLREFSEPMVFAVYGRARALPPYIGKGISRRNLVECVEFITGACSCTVKEQNPGVDLLVRYDWETAAAAVAEKFGAEEGNESQFGDSFFPELIVPSSSGGGAGTSPNTAGSHTPGSTDSSVAATGDEARPSESEASAGATEALTAKPETGETGGGETGGRAVETAGNRPASEQSASEQSASEQSASEQSASEQPASGNSSAPARATASAASPETAAERFQQSSSWSMVVVGGGLILALVVFFTATFVVLRPR